MGRRFIEEFISQQGITSDEAKTMLREAHNSIEGYQDGLSDEEMPTSIIAGVVLAIKIQERDECLTK